MSTDEKEQKRITRRDFVKGAAVGAAGVAAAGVLASCAQEATPCPPTPSAAQCTAPWLPEKWDMETDVLIVGSGTGGLSAGVEATKAGAGVLMLEQYKALRGMLGRISAAGTKWQEEAGIEDSPELFFEDMMRAGQYKNDPELVRIVTEQSADALNFLVDLGAECTSVKLGEGTLIARSHMGFPEKGGPGMLSAIEKMGGKLMLNTRLTGLFREGYLEGRVVGGKAVGEDGKELTIKANRAIIMATGRFREDEKMLLEHWPLLPKEYIRAAVPGVSGEFGHGLRAGMAINASMRHMDFIQLAPYISMIEGLTDITKAPQEVWVNLNGVRFTNESELRGKMAEDVFNQPKKTYFVILDSNPKILGVYGAGVVETGDLDNWVKAGHVIRANTIEELAKGLEKTYGVPAAAVVKTVADYNKYCETGVDLEFKKPKEALVKVELPPFYGGPPYTCQIAMTTGGFTTNAKAEVLDPEGEVIPGLYAAGMCCGGHHGQYSVMGNYQMDALVFGRIAGKNAAAFAP